MPFQTRYQTSQDVDDAERRGSKIVAHRTQLSGVLNGLDDVRVLQFEHQGSLQGVPILVDLHNVCKLDHLSHSSAGVSGSFVHSSSVTGTSSLKHPWTPRHCVFGAGGEASLRTPAALWVIHF